MAWLILKNHKCSCHNSKALARLCLKKKAEKDDLKIKVKQNKIEQNSKDKSGSYNLGVKKQRSIIRRLQNKHRQVERYFV